MAHQQDFHQIIPFDPEKDRFWAFDFTENNKQLTAEQIADTENFSIYIQSTIRKNNCRYGIGGYGEHRTIYARSKHYDLAMAPAPGGMGSGGDTEPRRLHLGIDIWGTAGTAVYSPMDGIVHSFAFNNNDSDYGATIILSHNLDGMAFHS
jgi:murein DD-endopeptidase MepM/ murein hydrolase activator NlpD